MLKAKILLGREGIQVLLLLLLLDFTVKNMKPGNMKGLSELGHILQQRKKRFHFKSGKKPIGPCQIRLTSAFRSCDLGRPEVIRVSLPMPT